MDPLMNWLHHKCYIWKASFIHKLIQYAFKKKLASQMLLQISNKKDA